MSRAAPAPIVIQFKKRTTPGAAPPSEDVDGTPVNGELGSTNALASGSGGEDAESSSSSRGASEDENIAKGSKATLAVKGPAVGRFEDMDSLMNVAGLAALVRSLHEDLEAFLKRESDKLSEQERRNNQARQNFKEASGLVRSFLDEFVPEGGLLELEEVEAAASLGDSDSADDDEGSNIDDPGVNGHSQPRRATARRQATRKLSSEVSKSEDSEQDEFSKKWMTQFVRFVTDDQRAIQDAIELLATFVQRHFSSHNELMELTGKPLPVQLFKLLLKTLSSEVASLSAELKRTRLPSADGRRPDDRGHADGRGDRGIKTVGGRSMDRGDRRGDARGIRGRYQGSGDRRDDRRGDDRLGRGDRVGDRRGDDRLGRGERGGDRRADDRVGRGDRGLDRRGDERGEHRGDRGSERDRRGDYGHRGKGDGRGRGAPSGRSRSRDARR